MSGPLGGGFFWLTLYVLYAVKMLLRRRHCRSVGWKVQPTKITLFWKQHCCLWPINTVRRTSSQLRRGGQSTRRTILINLLILIWFPRLRLLWGLLQHTTRSVDAGRCFYRRHAVAGKSRDATVNFGRYGVCRQLFSFDTFRGSWHGHAYVLTC